MENQHRKISGYRELTEDEIGAMNMLKVAGADLFRIMEQTGNIPDADKRCIAIAKTELQTAMMWAIRAVARPETPC